MDAGKYCEKKVEFANWSIGERNPSATNAPVQSFYTLITSGAWLASDAVVKSDCSELNGWVCTFTVIHGYAALNAVRLLLNAPNSDFTLVEGA